MDTPLYRMVTYPANSYIILENEKKSQQFFIIKDGKVNLKRDFPVAGEKPSELLGPGDFFGVISAMSQLPQIESAISLSPVNLIAVSFNRFGELIQKNSPLALKIIRYFSKKLRQYDDKDTGTRASGSSNPDQLNLLVSLAEHYLQTGQKSTAAYMLKSYLKYQPAGELAKSATEKLTEIGDMEESQPQGTNRIYTKDMIIFCENEPGNDLFIVQKGKIRITKLINKTEIQLNVMKPGDIFGEMALLENKPRSASATAMEDCELLAINKQNFEAMSEKQPQLMTRIITILSERIWNSYKKVLNSYFTDPNTKLLDMMMILIERSRTKISNGISFDFQISVPELMKMTGILDDPEKVTKRIIQLYKFLKIENGNLYCTDISLLERQVSISRAKIKETGPTY